VQPRLQTKRRNLEAKVKINKNLKSVKVTYYEFKVIKKLATRPWRGFVFKQCFNYFSKIWYNQYWI